MIGEDSYTTIATPTIFLYMDKGVYGWGRYVYTVGLVTAKYTPRF